MIKTIKSNDDNIIVKTMNSWISFDKNHYIEQTNYISDFLNDMNNYEQGRKQIRRTSEQHQKHVGNKSENKRERVRTKSETRRKTYLKRVRNKSETCRTHISNESEKTV